MDHLLTKPRNQSQLNADYLKALYRRHYRGALTRIGASFVLWLFGVFAFYVDVMKTHHFTGISVSVLYLILINPPTLWILKQIKHKRAFANFSLFINFLEILGYTSIIYFCGGFEATYLTPIYAALITYVGIVSRRIVTFTIAAFCATAFTTVVILTELDFIPFQRIDPNFDPSRLSQVVYVSVVIALLFLVAYITSYTAGVLKKNRDKLRRQNLDLEERTKQLELADKDLKEAQYQLEISIKERTKELESANQELRVEMSERKRAEEERVKLEVQLQRAQKMEAIGTLAGGVAHDLNNILSGIVSYPELLLLDLPEDSSFRKPLLTIQKSGQKATAIVEDLLTLARRGVAVTDVVNLKAIISDYLKTPEFNELKIFHPNIQFEVNLDKDLLNILGSPIHLTKTVMNLICNAAEAMPDGGKTVISTSNQYIDRPIKGYDDVNEGDYVVLSVIDSGVGILPEDLERIFEPFYTKKVMGKSGTGLGMAVVWGAVKDHNGYIDVQSAEGKGTTFKLYFPVTRKETGRDVSLLSIEDYMGKSESILVVDDVEEQREIASEMLRRLGYAVTSVPSGEEAVEYLQKNSVDLIILDMIMDPGMDGLDTYKKIIEIHPGQKAIIASGFSETDRVRKAQKLGARAYVKKPYVLEKIGLAIKNELTRNGQSQT